MKYQNHVEKNSQTTEYIWSEVGNFCIRGISLLALLMSGFLAIQDGLQIDWWDMKRVLVICVITTVFITMIYTNKYLSIIGIGLGMVLEIYLVFFQFEYIEQEFIKCFYHVLSLVNKHYRMSFTIMEDLISENALVLVVFLAILMGLWSGKGIAGKKVGWLTFFPLIPAFGGGFLLGYAPGLEAVMCLLVGLGFILLKMHKEEDRAERKAKRMAFLLLCLAVEISNLFYQPISERLLVYNDEFNLFQDKQEDKMLALIKDNEKLSRSISDIFWKLNGQKKSAALSNEPPELPIEQVFCITVEHYPKEPLYVKNFVGAYYDEGRWYPASEEEFEEFSVNQNLEPEQLGEAVLNRMMSFRKERTMENTWIQIQYRSGNLSLLPYYTNIPDEALIVEDSGIRIMDKKYQFQKIRTETASEIKEILADAFEEPAVSMSEGDRNMLQAYEEYIKDRYTRLPEGQLDYFCDNWDMAYEILENGECSYSFDLEQAPEDMDIIEYFVFHQKKGYCMHFASAYTILLRGIGVPARYASGYLVLPQDFMQNEDGTYTAKVSGQRAHAWVEYYNKVTGWMPYEVTPDNYYSAVVQSGAEESMEEIVANLESESSKQSMKWGKDENGNYYVMYDVTESEKEEQEAQQQIKEEQKESMKEDVQDQLNELQSSEHKENDIESVKGKRDKTEQVIEIARIAFGMIGVFLLVVGLRRRFVWKCRKQRFVDADTKKAARAIVIETLCLLKVAGIELGETEDEIAFAQKTEQTLKCFKEGAFITFVEIARIARYGDKKLTKEQVEYLHHICKILMEYEKSKLNWYQRIWYRYGNIRIL